MFYRATKTTKHVLIDYLRRIFSEYERGTLVLTDGETKIRFGSTPKVMETHAWDRSEVPVVLLEAMSGPLEWYDMEDRIMTETVTGDDGRTYARDVLGGSLQPTIQFQCIAGSKEERDALTDTVALYLTLPRARLALTRALLTLFSKPVFTGERIREGEPTSDRKLYEGDLSLELRTEWQDHGPNSEILESLLLDLTFVPDLTVP